MFVISLLSRCAQHTSIEILKIVKKDTKTSSGTVAGLAAPLIIFQPNFFIYFIAPHSISIPHFAIRG